jgi:1,4-alpha-glucan branching enzyme
MPPSQRPYMGAIPYDTGCTFRVWAPFAQEVAVSGDFNSWSTTANPLYSENNGYWSTDIDGVGVGSQYRFLVVGALGQPLSRNDPYARSIVHANGV